MSTPPAASRVPLPKIRIALIRYMNSGRRIALRFAIPQIVFRSKLSQDFSDDWTVEDCLVRMD